MSPQPRQRSPLFLLDAYGWSGWNVWALGEGALSEWCPDCKGRGFTVHRKCLWREVSAEVLATHGAVKCAGAITGCSNKQWPCRERCHACHGQKLRLSDAVRAEDFGDAESLEAAQEMFPGLVLAFGKRSDMHAAAL